MKRQDSWVRCDCLTEEIVEEHDTKHGTEYLRLSKGLNKYPSLSAFCVMLHNQPRGIYGFFGGRTQIRWKVVGEILRTFIKRSDAESLEVSVGTAFFSELVDAKFTPERSIPEKYERYQVLWLQLEYTRRHSWNDSVFVELMRQRQGRLTLISSNAAIRHNAFAITQIDVEALLQ